MCYLILVWYSFYTPSSRNGNFHLKWILSWYSCGYIAYFVGFSKFFVSLGLLYSYLFINKYLLPFQIRNETPELAKGATKALFDFYDVVTHELLSSDLRLVHSLSLFACAFKCLLFIHSLWNLNWGCINFFFPSGSNLIHGTYCWGQEMKVVSSLRLSGPRILKL